MIVFKEMRRKDREVEQKEAIEILKKYSKKYLEKGKEYIKNAGAKVKVIKINIENISGKARR